jgi:hypothetical protein
VELGSDTKAVLLVAGFLFPWALLLGPMKYRQMLSSPEGVPVATAVNPTMLLLTCGDSLREAVTYGSSPHKPKTHNEWILSGVVAGQPGG